jgi:hypothetical protein
MFLSASFCRRRPSSCNGSFLQRADASTRFVRDVINADVRYRADFVRFTPRSGHSSVYAGLPLL